MLYEFGTTRSARCRWLLMEAGIPFESIDLRPHDPRVLAVNPSGKLPVLVVNGEAVTESAAICTYLADLSHNKFVAPSGTLERAQHDQWVSFALTELDAWRWSSYLMSLRLPESERSQSVNTFNDQQWLAAVEKVLEPHLKKHPYLVGDAFSCADIILAWSLNWGRRNGLLGDDKVYLPATKAYLKKLLARPHCALAKD